MAKYEVTTGNGEVFEIEAEYFDAIEGLVIFYTGHTRVGLFVVSSGLAIVNKANLIDTNLDIDDSDIPF